jgi:hypothetical protein
LPSLFKGTGSAGPWASRLATGIRREESAIPKPSGADVSPRPHGGASPASAVSDSSAREAVEGFGPATRAWFAARFGVPTDVQRRGWAHIAAGEHALLIAPTGSGKTLAAFLASSIG